MANELVALIGDAVAGHLVQQKPLPGRAALHRFEYSEDYRNSPGATPLSLSMPLHRRVHEDALVTPWLWGLLPDNSQVLRRWARSFQVTENSPFALLSSPVGEDCAGAVRFVRPQRLDAALARPGSIEWLDEASVAARIHDLRVDQTSWLGPETTGRFSLAGAQAKTALVLEDGRWGVPSGSVSTTHILKPAIVGRDDHDLNEHLCLTAARTCGMSVAHSRIETFGDERVIVVSRYDRTTGAGGRPRRLHQEDTGQALSVHPANKYQSDGGPSASAVSALLRDNVLRPDAETDLVRFTDALIFNWLIGGTDAHAKNYSLLLSGSRVRLAPLYDIGSALPYPDLHVRKLRLAMKFGGDYSLLPRSKDVWTKVGSEVGLPPTVVIERARHLIETVPDAFSDAAADPAVKELGSAMPARLVDAVAERVRSCATALR